MDEGMLKALGRVIVNFNAIEHWTATWAGQLISWDPILGQIITCELSFKNLRALLSSLCKYKVEDEKLLKLVEVYLGEMARLEQQRNELVHSCWLESKPGESHHRLKITAKEGTGWKQGIHEVTLQQVNDLADKLRDLEKLLTLVGAQLSLWRDGDPRKRSPTVEA